MWNRIQIKENAKYTVKQYYWMSILAMLIVYGISYVASSVIVGVYYVFMTIVGTVTAMLQTALNNSVCNLITVIVMLVLVLLVYVIAFGVSICVQMPLMVGYNRFCCVSRHRKAEIGELFFSFQKDYYGNSRYKQTAKTSFFYMLYIFLWSLLFVVPGIVKSYEYFAVPYIMAENPNISTKRAFEISKFMTDGEKANLFVMQLSFIGWFLLGLLACCVGEYFVYPYFFAAQAEAYEYLRTKAITCGFVREDELVGFYEA